MSDQESESDPERKRPGSHKQSMYFPSGMLGEIREEAIRLNRSVSWVVQRAWKMAKGEIGKIDPP